MTGTNNLACHGTEEILRKYEKLIEKAKEKKCERVVIIGIVTRMDLGYYYESKRIAINMQLEKMCKKMKVDFLEFECYKERQKMLWKDGFHLNDIGSDRLARMIYQRVENKTATNLN
ncbi:MAG: SGNH/GDSL hydrolase family protein [Oscillospiraceae bacterium]